MELRLIRKDIFSTLCNLPTPTPIGWAFHRGVISQFPVTAFHVYQISSVRQGWTMCALEGAALPSFTVVFSLSVSHTHTQTQSHDVILLTLSCILMENERKEQCPLNIK